MYTDFSFFRYLPFTLFQSYMRKGHLIFFSKIWENDSKIAYAYKMLLTSDNVGKMGVNPKPKKPQKSRFLKTCENIPKNNDF